MGNKASTSVVDCKGGESDQGTVKTTRMSSSTLGTQPSDDQLRELVEATAEETSTPAKPQKGMFAKIGNALFAPPEPPQPPSPPRIKFRLCHCETDDEHRAYIAELLDHVKYLHGEEGLREAGFEYRKLYCPEHEPVIAGLSPAVLQKKYEDTYDSTQEEKKCDVSVENESEQDLNMTYTSSAQFEEDFRDKATTRAAVMNGIVDINSSAVYKPCFQCATRLYYYETNTLITEENRNSYVADGVMYEEVTRLAQECAQDAMQREGNLEWVTVCDDPAHKQPVRALVHEDHHLVSMGKKDTADDHPTLLIATGRGKVKAGIFSRQHLLTSGMESSTALPMIREATQRQMSVVIFDPNARGDRKGMESFEKSFEVVLGHLDNTNAVDSDPAVQHTPPKRALYIVAHSASGSQLVRYMLDRVHGYLPHLRAIAFTDSTHNIQWTRKNEALQSLLGSNKCVYFRSASKNNDDLWRTRKAGETVETDSFWEHRFGGIKTLWAGTEEHSLMNWFAHTHIWDHFDEHLETVEDGSEKQ